MELVPFYAFSFLVAALAFAFAAYLYVWVKKKPTVNETIQTVSGLIKAGANTFMTREYKILARFAVGLAVLIFIFLPSPVWATEKITDNVFMAIAYLFGTVLSAIAGKIGILVATLSNGRCAEAAPKGIKPAFLVGFRGGAVMGLLVVGCALFGVAGVLWIVGDTSILLGFSFGASSLALFAKAGGGIFTKTADVAADITGKVELGIPEDDPRNPAVIADNVGDNVGDVAGMGADLFDSNVAAMVSALVIAQSLGGWGSIATVFCYSLLGLLASIIGIATARIGKNGTPTKALNASTYVTTTIFLGLSALATALIPEFSWYIWGASATGLLVGVVIGLATDYFTDDSKPIVKKVAHASASGPAFTVLSGCAYGFLSALPAMVGIAVSALISYNICAASPLFEVHGTQYCLFGISMAAVGMLSTVATIISNDAYGPIVDNARGLAEMGGLGEETIDTADELDSAGNTVKAVTKGFSIGAAGLTVISLLGAFMTEVNNASPGYLSGFDLMDPVVFFGILIGAAIPAVFSAMLILGVDKNAQRMVAEIRRQFASIVGLREGTAKPDYDKCIDIATTGSLRELLPAGLVAILSTVAVGFIGGPKAIGGFLLGNIVSGLLLSLFMSNAGGLWDNSKKYVESGHEGGKGSEAHKAAVIGDTVGDPFKDTAGPSINTQITVVSLVASLLSTLFVAFSVFG
ncbi:MAG: sodium-translocating pyrophosphatase [Clostridia bacterium]|nr:sodium-translocating pyrophosphatase [Clostridia bacterium]